MFKVGDKVKLSKVGKNRFTSGKLNPHDTVGEITKFREESLFTYTVIVDWPDYEGQCYKEEHLQLEQEKQTMSNVIFTYSGDSVTVVLGGEIFTITSSEKSYESLIKELKKGTHDILAIEDLLDKRKAVEKFSQGSVTIEGSTVLYKGEEVNDSLTEKMVSLMDEGFNIGPWINFYENLQENPSFRSRKCLFNFLDKFQAPFTEDGCFVAFKRVDQDFKDLRTHQMDNSVGAVVTMPRSQVDDDPNNTCSSGLHVAASSYLDSYANASRAKTIMLKVNPRDVVAVPHDYNFAKMRVCQYEVMADVTVEQMSDLETRSVVTDSWDEDTDDEEGYTWEEGDYITCTDCGGTRHLTTGDEYEITTVDDSDGTVRVKADSGASVWLNFDGTYF